MRGTPETNSRQEWPVVLASAVSGEWAEPTIDFKPGEKGAFADELRFVVSKGAELLLDDVLLFEGGRELPGK